MTDDTMKLFDEIRAGLRQRREAQQEILDDVASKVFDAYRAALGEDFTAQEVIRTLTFGSEVRNWDTIAPEMQDALWALGTRHPKSVDQERTSGILSDSVIEYLRQQGLNVSDEQAKLFPNLMTGIMQGLESAGVKFNNGVRQAQILGIQPLTDYRKWLVSGGQRFMDSDEYSLELNLTENAIRAYKDALATVLVAARDIKVDYGLKAEKIDGIVKAKIEQNTWDAPDFSIAYETQDGKKGKFNVLGAAITSLTEKADKNRLYDLLQDKKINPQYGSENLGYFVDGSIASLVGLPQNVGEELRANVWKKGLKRFGVDFSQNAEAVLVNPSEIETVTFYYRTKNREGQDNGVMVAITSDERYHEKHAFVCTRDRMQESIDFAKRGAELLDDSAFNPLLEPMAARDYVQSRKRLTPHRS